VAEEYCWATTQAARQSCRGLSGYSMIFAVGGCYAASNGSCRRFGITIGPIFKSQDRAKRLSRDVDNGLPIYTVLTSQKGDDRIYARAEACNHPCVYVFTTPVATVVPFSLQINGAKSKSDHKSLHHAQI
jgi:hypothetical protein